MSAIKKEIVLVDVTRGDCLENNRKSGKSNTGTYFISSLKDYDRFKEYFLEEKNFVINLVKIKEYMILFKYCFANRLDEYIGKGLDFESFCNYLLSLKNNPKVEITLRINDSRVFMRFKDNSNVVVNAFRNLLYEDLTYICIEKNGELFEVYPIINSAMVSFGETSIDNGFSFDD